MTKDTTQTNASNRFLELVEKVYGKPIREGIKIQLKRHDEEIIDAYPLREAEHNWFPGDANPKDIAKRLLNGYQLDLKDKKGNTRTIGFDTYMEELINEWKEYLRKNK